MSEQLGPDPAEGANGDQGQPGAADPGPSLAAACEAILLLAAEPIDPVELASILARPVAEVRATVQALSAEYSAAGRGFDLRETGGGWRYYTRANCAEVVSRYATDGASARLSQAALETLAIVAYRQPIPRARISGIRGVNVDGVVRTLISRGLLAESGTDPDTHATLLVTTSYFLERLGIANLGELPPLAEHIPDYDQLGELRDWA